MAPGADPHTDGAIRADLGPVPKTGFRIQLPSQASVDFLVFAVGNGGGGAAMRTFFTNPAKILNTDIHRLIANHRQVGCHSKYSYPGTQLLGNQIPEAAQFTQTGINSRRRQEKIVMAAVVGGGRITQIGNKGGQLSRNPGTL